MHKFPVILMVCKSYIVKRKLTFVQQRTCWMVFQRILDVFPVSSVLTFIRTVSEMQSYVRKYPYLCTIWLVIHILNDAGILSIPPSIKGCSSLAEFYMGSYSCPLFKRHCLYCYLKVLHLWCSSGICHLKFSGIMHCRFYQRS